MTKADIFRKFYDELRSKNLLALPNSEIDGRREAEPGTLDFVMPNGSSSIVKHFFSKSGVEAQFDHFVESVKLEGSKWLVTTKVRTLL